SDWKFLAISLGFNAANSNYFCPWCIISKKQVANYNQEWTISKKMDQLKQNLNIYNGHRFLPLFDMILLDHWIPDELHVMLRITDRLWALVLHEIEENESQTWNYTSLMGKDKLKDEFYNLYKAMCNPLTDPNKFKESTKNWLKLFLTPSTGTPDNLV
ncbi:819_t:CDS:2, partial [Gigaspora margarita]